MSIHDVLSFIHDTVRRLFFPHIPPVQIKYKGHLLTIGDFVDLVDLRTGNRDRMILSAIYPAAGSFMLKDGSIHLIAKLVHISPGIWLCEEI